MRSLDHFRGCLLGGAAGDALGYPVEFMSVGQIYRTYGEQGIAEYSLTEGVAEISDDTQMTLFTAVGLLNGATRGNGEREQLVRYISMAYRDWLLTQTRQYPLHPGELHSSWLLNVPGLYRWRAPGNTCLTSAGLGANGTIEEPINDRNGCGGVMRMAPIGLFFNDRGWEITQVDRLGAEAAALTHGGELGYLPAAALVHIIHRLAENEGETVAAAVQSAMDTLPRLFPNAADLGLLLAQMQMAVDLAGKRVPDGAAIRSLGAGWVAEETLAIAIYCALKYPDDFERAVITAVNHGGDSDSTGAVTGNILGAHLGLQGIPERFLTDLELKELILQLADDLYYGCPDEMDPVWEQKYVKLTYRMDGQ